MFEICVHSNPKLYINVKPNALAKGRGRTKLGETGQSATPRPLERRVRLSLWLLILALDLAFSIRRNTAESRKTSNTFTVAQQSNVYTAVGCGELANRINRERERCGSFLTASYGPLGFFYPFGAIRFTPIAPICLTRLSGYGL